MRCRQRLRPEQLSSRIHSYSFLFIFLNEVEGIKKPEEARLERRASRPPFGSGRLGDGVRPPSAPLIRTGAPMEAAESLRRRGQVCLITPGRRLSWRGRASRKPSDGRSDERAVASALRRRQSRSRSSKSSSSAVFSCSRNSVLKSRTLSHSFVRTICEEHLKKI